MKKILFSAGLMFLCSYQVAQAIPAEGLFEKLYTTDSYGDTTEKNSFSLDETPYLYAKLPQVETGDLTTLLTSWNSGGTSAPAGVQNANAVSEFWLTPTNWDAVKHTGTWDITTYFAVDKPLPLSFGDIIGGSEVTPKVTSPYEFSVTPTSSGPGSGPSTPEPISASLFLLGGSALAARKMRKKKEA